MKKNKKINNKKERIKFNLILLIKIFKLFVNMFKKNFNKNKFYIKHYQIIIEYKIK